MYDGLPTDTQDGGSYSPWTGEHSISDISLMKCLTVGLPRFDKSVLPPAHRCRVSPLESMTYDMSLRATGVGDVYLVRVFRDTKNFSVWGTQTRLYIRARAGGRVWVGGFRGFLGHSGV